MINYGELLLSKVIEENNINALLIANLKETDFITQVEKDAFNFIIEYARMNRNQAPDYRTVIGSVPGFNYREDCKDSIQYMAKQLKDYSLKIDIMNVLNKDASKKFNELDGTSYVDWLTDTLTKVKQEKQFNDKIGTDLVKDANDYLAEYKARKNGESFKVWKSAFPTMNNTIGGYLSGNVYTWYGRSGRGKSIFTMVEAIESALQGATVLIWAMEMNKFEWLTRAYTYISAKQQLKSHKVNGTSFIGGFEAKNLLQGNLDEVDEVAFMEFLANINSIIKGKIIIRAVDDTDFYNRSCNQLQSDILSLNADVVVIDPIYYMDFERNTSNTAGGDVANTSKKIRHIAGHTKAVIHVITQAEEVTRDTDEEGNRVLTPPNRSEIKKTKAVLEDATNTFGIDTLDGRFMIVIGKGRNGGEGTTIEGVFLAGIGAIKEYTKEEIVDAFEDYGF